MQSSELKKNPLFEILFAAFIGTLVRFAGPPGRHSRLNHHAVLNFYVEILGHRFSAAFAVLTAAENTHGRFAEKFGKKFGGKNLFSLRLSLCFLLFSGHPILRAFFNLQIEKIRAESVLQELSLKVSGAQGTHS